MTIFFYSSKFIDQIMIFRMEKLSPRQYNTRSFCTFSL